MHPGVVGGETSAVVTVDSLDSRQKYREIGVGCQIVTRQDHAAGDAFSDHGIPDKGVVGYQGPKDRFIRGQSCQFRTGIVRGRA